MRDDARASGPIWLTPAAVLYDLERSGISISRRTLDKWTEQFKLPWRSFPRSRKRVIRADDWRSFVETHLRLVHPDST